MVQTPLNQISLYRGTLTVRKIAENVKRIKSAFPDLPLSFYDVLTDRLEANGFTDDRLRDAVNHVIDTSVYPRPTIAEFISFDRCVRIYSFEEMLKKWDEGLKHSYAQIEIPGRSAPAWAHIADIEKYKLTKHE